MRRLAPLLAAFLLSACQAETPRSESALPRPDEKTSHLALPEAALPEAALPEAALPEAASPEAASADVDLVFEAAKGFERCLDAGPRAVERCADARQVFELARAESESSLAPTSRAWTTLLQARWFDASGGQETAAAMEAARLLGEAARACAEAEELRVAILCLDAPSRIRWLGDEPRAAARELLERQLHQAREAGQAEILADVLESHSSRLRRRAPRLAYARQQEIFPILEELGLQDTPRFANLLRERGTLKARLGDYAGAFDDLTAAASRLEAMGLTADRRYVLLRAELGHLLLRLGDLEEAEKSLAQALTRATMELGKEDTAVGEVAGFLAEVRLALGELEGAEKPLRLAEKAAMKWRGPRRWRRARMALRRAQLERRRGRLGAAETTIEGAVETLEETQAAFHLLADSLSEKGRILFLQERWHEAEATLERALELNRQALGDEHGRTAWSLALLAELYVRRGDPGTAMPLAIRAEERFRALLRLAIDAFSERQVLRLATGHERGLDLAIAAALESGEPEHRRQAWRLLVGSRRLGLESLAHRAWQLAASTGPDAAPTYERLRSVRQELAAALLQPAPSATPLKRLSEQAESLERELLRLTAHPDSASTSTAPSRGRAKRGPFETRKLAAALPPGGVLISFARVPMPGAEARYVAFLLCSQGGVPELVDLGPRGPIDQHIDRWTRQIRRASAGLRPAAALEEEQRRLGRALRRIVWDPLARRMPSVERVFLINSGELHRVAWAALPMEDQRYLLESGPIFHTLHTERELASMDAHREKRARATGLLLAVGDPGRATPLAPPRQRIAGTCRWPPTTGFENLPGARKEVDAIARLWRQYGGEAKVLIGDGARLSALRRAAPAARVLHLSTHSYLVPEPCRSALLRDRLDAPLLVGGLVLAPEAHGSEADDDLRILAGTVPSETLATLQLRADLVVLSGCETGLGDALALEGVLGLRSALHRAGARSILTSHWPVVDEEAGPWLEDFYRHWLDGAPLDRAAHDASLAALRRLRRSERATLPALWAPFSTIGDWR